MRSSLIAATLVLVSLGVAGCGDREEEGAATEEPKAPADTPVTPEPSPKSPPREKAPEPGRPSHESLVDAMGDQMDAFAVALSSVKDEGSVDRVRQSLLEIEGAMRKIAGQLETMTPPSNEERQRLSGLMQAREDAMEDLLGSREDFLGGLDPQVREALLEAMTPFNSMLEEIGTVLELHFEPDGDIVVPPVEETDAGSEPPEPPAEDLLPPDE